MHVHSISKLKITKRGIQIALGLLWLLDGALQLQHQMFSSAFATQVIAPAGQGQPIPVYGPINFEIHMLLLHPALYDMLFALVQLALGVLILHKKTSQLGLRTSVIWGFAVWYLGEGMGGLLSGQTSVLMGAPGAALIYALLALAVLPSKERKESDSKDKPASWLPIVWAVLWFVGAIYQLLPGQNSISDLSSSIAANAGNGAPGWLSSVDIHVSNIIAGFGKNAAMNTKMKGMTMSNGQMGQFALQTHHSSGLWFIILLAAIQAAIGLMVFLPRIYKITVIYIGIALSLLFWLIGQSLGAYFSGLATDPNTAPLIILLGVAVLGTDRLNFKRLKNGIKNAVQWIDNELGNRPVIKAQ